MTKHKDLYIVNRYGDIFFLAKERIVKITPKRVYFTEPGCTRHEHIDKDDRIFEDVEEAKKLSRSIYYDRIEESMRITEQLERQGHEQQRADWFKEATWFNTRSSY